jgi:serine/threonine-protein kinase
MISSVANDLPRWQRINSLLQEALELEPHQREAWLQRIASEQPDALPILQSLLARQSVETDSFMAHSVASLWAHAVGTAADTEAYGQSIGPYQLLRELGKGGMATVWLAQRIDGGIQRQVAIKLPLYGWARGVAERLEQERDALAALEHPNIARLYDAGVTAAGRPYLAMEFVDGVPIDVFAIEHGLPAREKLGLFLQVASAVTYAHGRLIVHRDLKPTNILVTAGGGVRLLDFGAAKLLRDDERQDSLLTREVGRALSPDYASPEQIQGERMTVGTDVYSLGVVLFELLTGQRPYKLDRHSTAALQSAIASTEVPLLSSVVAHDRKLQRELRGDLENIVAKALKKLPQERYATVDAFADDVRRWLNFEPVRARRDSVAYRIGKFTRRNRLAVAAGVLVFTAVTLAASVTTGEMFEARRQRDEAHAQTKRAQAQERFANMMMEQFGPGGRALTREEMIERSVQILDQQYSNDPRFVAEELLSISDWYMDLGNTEKEMAILQRAESIAKRLADPALSIAVQCRTAESEIDKGRIEAADKRMKEALALLARAPKVEPGVRITCMDAEATLADAHGERAKAVERIEAAIALQERLDRTDQTYRSLLSRAQVLYLYAGRPKDAYAVIEKTFKVLEETDASNSEALFGAYHNQALALNQMGELRGALAGEQKALAITTGNDPNRPVAALLAQLLARLYTRLNHPAEGEAWSQRALAAAREGGNVTAQIVTLATLAEAAVSAGHIDRASAAAQEAAHLLTASSDPRERAAAARAQALVAMERRDMQTAQAASAALLEAIGYPDKARVRASQAADLQLLLAARVALRSGQPTEAERLAADALEIATDLARDPQSSAAVGEARLLLATALYAQGKNQDANAAIHGAALALGSSLSTDHPLTIEASKLEASL